MFRRAAPLVAVLVLIAGVPAAAPAAEPRSKPARLKTFASCDSLLRFARANALRTGAVGGIAPRPSAPLPIESREGDAPAPALPTPAAGAGDDFSTTNVQEAGIDEPDLIKTDGTTVFAVAGDALHAIEVGRDAPRLRDTLDLSGGHGHALLLHEGRALVISQAFPGPVPVDGGPARPVTSAPAGDPPATILTEVDVRDPAAMRVVRTVRAEGSYTSARLTGATARVVLTAAPELAAPTRAAIRASRLATWLPRGVVTTERTGRRRGRRLVPCSSIRRPRAFSGLAVLTVLTIDMDRGLPWVDADAIMSDAHIVYGSPDSLYVATQRWIDPTTPVDGLPASATTQIHRFDAAGAGSTSYRATGEVPGHLLNQFSLSEHDGVLRVASTEEPVWLGGEERSDAGSASTPCASSPASPTS
jgi:hypothetical protein